MSFFFKQIFFFDSEIEEAVIEGEKTVVSEKPNAEEEAVDGKKENPANERVEEPENKVNKYQFFYFFIFKKYVF